VLLGSIKNSVIVVVLMLLVGCRATNLVFMTVYDPAPVSLPQNARKVGLVKRLNLDEANKKLVMLNKISSLESEAILREGSNEALKGLREDLLANDRFTEIVFLDSLPLATPGTNVFPNPLSWQEVEKIASKFKLDAVFSLEMYDTELKIMPLSIPTSLNSATDILNTLHRVQLTTIIKTGWRIYYPTSRVILDEYSLVKNLNFTASASNPIAAAEALVGRKEAIKQTSYQAGKVYALRILPVRFRVNRDYFVRGRNHNFRIAMRRARTGNWDGAAEKWQSLTKSSKRITAGRACHNMAIINEINGNLDNAIEWSRKAYEDYRIRKSLSYLNVLRFRKRQAERLEMQNSQ
jgi:hypothetical protein